MNISPLVFTDFYKTDHRRQYPEGTEYVYSNLTPRSSRIDGVDEVVVFGLQYFIKEYLINQFNENFFNKDREEVARQYKRRLDNALGKDAVPIDHIYELWDLRYMPVHIKALPEGTLCPIKVPCLTITNTHPKFFWVTNFLETIMSSVLWGPMNSATLAYTYRRILSQYARDTSDMPEFVDWQGHDFSFRGMWGLEAPCLSGAAHLLSFTGTDTIPAIDFLEQYYKADSDKELIGGSVSATEHSVMSLGGNESEIETFRRLITKVYPSGIVSIVSDTWDYFKVLSEYAVELKDVIEGRDGKVVFRPDTGDPVKIICGDDSAELGSPAYKGSVQLLWDIFGGTVNSKGYKQLNPKVGLIYGDSITLERARAICEGLKKKGFASTNIVFGIGSYTYTYATRDTFGFAIKATCGLVNGEKKEIYKEPKTDTNNLKKSARGLLKVEKRDGKLVLLDRVSVFDEIAGELRPVFKDGKLLVDEDLATIRARLRAYE